MTSVARSSVALIERIERLLLVAFAARAEITEDALDPPQDTSGDQGSEPVDAVFDPTPTEPRVASDVVSAPFWPLSAPAAPDRQHTHAVRVRPQGAAQSFDPPESFAPPLLAAERTSRPIPLLRAGSAPRRTRP